MSPNYNLNIMNNLASQRLKTVSVHKETPPSADLSLAEEERARLLGVRDLQRRLGEIVGLMAFSHSYEYLFLGELKWQLLPPLSLCQYRLVRNKNKEAVAYVSWAYVNEEVEEQLSAGKIKLRLAEWKSGDQIVIMDMLLSSHSEAGQNRILSELKEKVFSGKAFKVLCWDEEKRQWVLWNT